MQKIIVVDGYSTSVNYFDDIKQLGYEPIILEAYSDDGGDKDAKRKKNYEFLKKPWPKIYSASKDYQETLNFCKTINPVLILAGSERSVELATTLAYDMGLKCNDKHNLPKMTRKSEMHKALKEAGIRYIHGKMISNVDEAIDFFASLDHTPVVLKPDHSAASLGVHICDTADQIVSAFDEIYGSLDMYGDRNTKVLIQEAINGTEYVVNTVTSNGKSYVDSLYRYKKKQLPGGAKLYSYFESVMKDEITPQIQRLCDYAINVNKAIGIEFGPVHGEFYIDENGPVLVEVNCRICGGDMQKEFLDAMFGHHETNRSLEAYLDKEAFENHYQSGYNSVGKGYLKYLITPSDCDIVDAPVARIVREKESFIYMMGIHEHTKMHLNKTIGLTTNGGCIALAHKDRNIVNNDCRHICDIEENHFEKLFTLV